MSPRGVTAAERLRWQVDRERFQLPDPSPPAPYRLFKTDEVLQKVMKKIGLEQPMWEQTLMNDWPSIAGPQVAQHSRPGKLERRILHVYVKNSIWLMELRGASEKALLNNVQKRLGKNIVSGIRLQMDPDG